MALQIKIPQVYSNSQQITLDGTVYTLKNYWNTRDEAWRISLIDADDEPILLGLKVMPNQNLTTPYKATPNIGTRLPSGNIWCVRTTTDKSVISDTNFGTGLNYQLWYLTSEEEEENGLSV